MSKILIKKSSIGGKVPLPGDIQPGELAVNLTDAILYTKNTNGEVISLTGTTGDGSLPEHLHEISEVNGLQTALNSKVDKVTGQSLITDAEKTKLDGIATGATANASNTQLIARSNHTGVQAISTIVDLDTSLNAKVDKVTGQSLMLDDERTKLGGIASGAQVNVATNLSQGTRTSTTVPLTSSTGVGTTLPAATTTLAGVMIATDKVKINAISGTNTGDETASTIRTKLGVTTLSGSNTGDQVLPTLASLGGQAELISGTSIKTINNVSMLGSGNIEIVTQAEFDETMGDISAALTSINGV